MIKDFRILQQSYKIFSSLSSKLIKFKIVLTFNCRLCIVFNKLLLSITKLQNLKAIHNYTIFICKCNIVVINHKTTKFESNSQPHSRGQDLSALLLSITKLQNLKAIHN